MRKLIALALVAASPALFADGNTATESASATVNLYAPIVLTKVSDVNFGALVYDGTALAVPMAANGTVTGPKYIGTKIDTAVTTTKAGAFHFTKDLNLTVAIKVNDQICAGATQTLTAMALGDPMVMWTPKVDVASSPSAGDITVYGDLAIAAGAATKSYLGTFTVNVAYN